MTTDEENKLISQAEKLAKKEGITFGKALIRVKAEGFKNRSYTEVRQSNLEKKTREMGRPLTETEAADVAYAAVEEHDTAIQARDHDAAIKRAEKLAKDEGLSLREAMIRVMKELNREEREQKNRRTDLKKEQSSKRTYVMDLNYYKEEK